MRKPTTGSQALQSHIHADAHSGEVDVPHRASQHSTGDGAPLKIPFSAELTQSIPAVEGAVSSSTRSVSFLRSKFGKSFNFDD